MVSFQFNQKKYHFIKMNFLYKEIKEIFGFFSIQPKEICGFFTKKYMVSFQFNQKKYF